MCRIVPMLKRHTVVISVELVVLLGYGLLYSALAVAYHIGSVSITWLIDVAPNFL